MSSSLALPTRIRTAVHVEMCYNDIADEIESKRLRKKEEPRGSL
jgi:hypothetical protein